MNLRVKYWEKKDFLSILINKYNKMQTGKENQENISSLKIEIIFCAIQQLVNKTAL